MKQLLVLSYLIMMQMSVLAEILVMAEAHTNPKKHTCTPSGDVATGGGSIKHALLDFDPQIVAKCLASLGARDQVLQHPSHPPPHPPTHPPTHSLTHLLTYSLTYISIHLLSHSFT